jgi:hypothetical protein
MVLAKRDGISTKSPALNATTYEDSNKIISGVQSA